MPPAPPAPRQPATPQGASSPDRLAQPEWPYPRWIAHRGAGLLAPENTLAAFRHGAALGQRMFECDVKLSADGELFLLHDDTLERCSNGRGTAGSLDWFALSRLDAGSWHSPAFAGEPPPRLAAVLQFCAANGLALNIEIKPNPGQAAGTGQAVVQLLQAMRADWPRHTPLPLLSSFEPEALRAAQRSGPHWPRALLIEAWSDTALAQCADLGCVALIAHHPLWQAQRVQAARQAGLRCAAYTVNDAAEARRLLALGLDSLISDAVDAFGPDQP